MYGLAPRPDDAARMPDLRDSCTDHPTVEPYTKLMRATVKCGIHTRPRVTALMGSFPRTPARNLEKPLLGHP